MRNVFLFVSACFSVLAMPNVFAIDAVEGSDSVRARMKHDVSVLASDEFGGRGAMQRGDTLTFRYLQAAFESIPNMTLLGDEGLQEF